MGPRPAALPVLPRLRIPRRTAGVLGDTPDAVAHALLFRQWSDVVDFTHTSELTDADRGVLIAAGIRIVDGTVARFVSTPTG